MPRIFALSDLHVDYPQNMQRMAALSDQDYRQDVLILCGDISDSLEKIDQLFTMMLAKFRAVCFVPGNHELWVRDEQHNHSLEKFESILALCKNVGVHTEPVRFEASGKAVWLVPLFSWYRLSHEGEQSLYVKKQGERWNERFWLDMTLCQWPDSVKQHPTVADYFASLNHGVVNRDFDAPVISYSHFLPRKELVFDSTKAAAHFVDKTAVIPPYASDPLPKFNFTNVAGCQSIDTQIRQLGAVMHIYGHQHRNRCRHIDGVTYVSNCVGNAREFATLGHKAEPRLVWDYGQFIEPDDRL